jgi:RNA polymerase sigma-70 factor (ECF subfamily)
LALVAGDARLEAYQPYWAALAELLRQTGDHEAATSAYDRAIVLQPDPAARDFLVRRRAGLVSIETPPAPGRA